MKNFRSIALAFSLFFVFSPLALASCPFLQVNSISSQEVNQGELGYFTIVVRNLGDSTTRVSLSAKNPEKFFGIDFDSTVATLAPSDSQAFHLFADTKSVPAGSYDIELNVEGFSCTETQFLHLKVNAVKGTQAPFSASVYPDYAVHAITGDSVEFTVYLKNYLAQSVYAQIEAVDNKFPQNTDFSEDKILLEANSDKLVKVSVRIPPGTPGGDYNLILKVSASSTTDAIVLTPVIRVFEPSASLELQNDLLSCVKLRQGEDKTHEFTLKNLGKIRGPFRLGVSGSKTAQQVVSITPPEMELKQGEFEPVDLSIKTSDATIPLGTYRFFLDINYLQFTLVHGNYCFEVVGERNYSLEVPERTAVKQGGMTSFAASITNIGSLDDTFVIEITPQTGLQVTASPQVFKLSPQQKSRVSFQVSASSTLPPGDYLIAFAVRSRGATVFESLPLKVLPESPNAFVKVLSLDSYNFVQGRPKGFDLRVENKRKTPLLKPLFSIKGIPSTWYTVSGPEQIPGEQGSYFSVDFNPREAGIYPVTFSITLGDEEFTQDSQIIVEIPAEKLDFSYEVNPVVENGVTKEVVVKVVIQNKGNIEAIGVTPQLPPSNDLILVGSLNQPVSLKPGEEQEIAFALKPSADSSPEKTVVLSFSSATGAQIAKKITVPTMGSFGLFGLSWGAIALLVLLILLVAFVVTRRKKE